MFKWQLAVVAGLALVAGSASALAGMQDQEQVSKKPQPQAKVSAKPGLQPKVSAKVDLQPKVSTKPVSHSPASIPTSQPKVSAKPVSHKCPTCQVPAKTVRKDQSQEDVKVTPVPPTAKKPGKHIVGLKKKPIVTQPQQPGPQPQPRPQPQPQPQPQPIEE